MSSEWRPSAVGLGTACVLSIMLAGCGPDHPPGPPMKKFTAPDGSFSVMMPATPEVRHHGGATNEISYRAYKSGHGLPVLDPGSSAEARRRSEEMDGK